MTPALLFDENLSPRLVSLLRDNFPEAVHVAQVGLGAATDLEIYLYAAKTGRTIVTNDSDFNALSAERGPPPKIIWLRSGNARTKNVCDRLTRSSDAIRNFASNPVLGLLELR